MENDGDVRAAALDPGCADRLQRRLTNAVGRFYVENGTRTDSAIMFAVVLTHMLDLLRRTMVASGGDPDPDAFVEMVTDASARIARGEHEIRVRQ
jgi:hypothetical protein